MVAVVEVVLESVRDVIDHFQSGLFQHLSGSSIGKPTKRSVQLFFMVCHDTDRFREFVVSEDFTQFYVIPVEEMNKLLIDDADLMRSE